MIVLLLGLVIFLGIHSTRIVAEPFRARMLQRLGEGRWKGMYSLASALGLGLIVLGYGLARTQPVVLWMPPTWTRHLAALLMLGSFVLLAAAYVPRNAIKARLHHPMMLGIKLWALGHLLANGTLADLVLFGAFLVWAVLGFRAARQRDRAGAVAYTAGTAGGTLTAVGIGLVAWAVFAFWLHGWLIGVQPFG
jgi:uncharacterized membrane protein